MKELRSIKQNWIEEFNNKPLIIAGPCSAESEEQILKTALRIDKSYIQVFRAGIWKPRTKPNNFEGIGIDGLSWLKKVKSQTGLMTATEVANAEHVKHALKYDIDILWIGARSTVNPFTIQEIANSLEGSNKIILVKNPINPDIDLWIGALERFINKGITKLGIIHRGFSIYKKSKFRNQPNWGIALDFKRQYPNIPIICDPSHICGNRENIFEISQQAFNFGYNGLMIETHYDPDKAWSDAKQQITPENLLKLLKKIKIENYYNTQIDKYQLELNSIRTQIDELDQNLLYILYERMQMSQKISNIKKEYNISIFQPERSEIILQQFKNEGKFLKLNEKFTEKIFKIIHEESMNIQNRSIIQSNEKIYERDDN